NLLPVLQLLRRFALSLFQNLLLAPPHRWHARPASESPVKRAYLGKPQRFGDFREGSAGIGDRLQGFFTAHVVDQPIKGLALFPEPPG
ncbi:hypothetical protein R0K18_30410, partial [Pantoea sp. SIMBA_133]